MSDEWLACRHPERALVQMVTVFHHPSAGCHACVVALQAKVHREPETEIDLDGTRYAGEDAVMAYLSKWKAPRRASVAAANPDDVYLYVAATEREIERFTERIARFADAMRVGIEHARQYEHLWPEGDRGPYFEEALRRIREVRSQIATLRHAGVTLDSSDSLLIACEELAGPDTKGRLIDLRAGESEREDEGRRSERDR